jgi:EpsI family protein
MNFRIVLVTMTLLLSFGLRVWLNVVPTLPKRQNLASFPRQAGSWSMAREGVLDDLTAEVLKADDYVLRTYREKNGELVDLFIAYYENQQAGESMHSPKNCLPGSGWEIVKGDQVALWPDDPARPVQINRYLIENGAQRALMLYWYQSGGRVIASEYWAKIYLVLDALRTGRRDGGIVRFVVPIRKGSDGSNELKTGLEMARSMVPLLSDYLPNYK